VRIRTECDVSDGCDVSDDCDKMAAPIQEAYLYKGWCHGTQLLVLWTGVSSHAQQPLINEVQSPEVSLLGWNLLLSAKMDNLANV